MKMKWLAALGVGLISAGMLWAEEKGKEREIKTQMVLTLEGFGGYNEDKHLKEPIEINAWSWGLNGQDGQEMTVTKYAGPETPHLIKLIYDNIKIKKATLQIKNKSTQTFTLHDVRITSIGAGGSQQSERLTENLSLSFKSAEVQFQAPGQKPTSTTIPPKEN